MTDSGWLSPTTVDWKSIQQLVTEGKRLVKDFGEDGPKRVRSLELGG